MCLLLETIKKIHRASIVGDNEVVNYMYVKVGHNGSVAFATYFESFRVVSGRFGSFRVVSGRFGSFHVLVSTQIYLFLFSNPQVHPKSLYDGSLLPNVK